MYLERVVVLGGQRCPLHERDWPRVKDWSAEAINKVLKSLKRAHNDFLDFEGVDIYYCTVHSFHQSFFQ